MPVLIPDFLMLRTFDELQAYCTDVMEDEQASSGTREVARQNLVMLHTITKPASPTTPEDNAAVRERVIDFLVRTLGHNSI